jgi:hypothetical protein
MRCDSFGNEAGATTVFVVSGMLGLMAICAAMLSSALTEHTAEMIATEAEQAVSFAEAGTAFALHEIDLNHDYGTDGVGRCSFTIAGGSAAVTIAPAYNGPNTYTLHAIGTHNKTTRAIDTVLQVRGTRFSSGFFGKDWITFSGSYQTDSYDSHAGPYASQVGPGGYAQSHGDLGSNGTITTSGGVLVHGDARPGPNGSYVGSPSAVTGTTAPTSSDRVLDPYTYSPPAIGPGGNLQNTTTLTSGTYRYSSVNIGGGKVLTFSGDVTLYVDNGFTISGSGFAVILPGATVTINHGTGNFVVSGSGILNNSHDPSALQIFSATVASNRVEISGSASFYGAVYAPYAAFVSSGGSQLYGAMVSKTMTLSGGAWLHYDTSLGSLGGAAVTILMQRATKP